MSNAIQIEHLCKEYNDFQLDDVSFALPKGYIMGFVGQNGAGKTTTIKLILNHMKRQSGTIQIFGLDNLAEEQQIKQDIAAVFDDTYFVANWKISEVEKAIRSFYAKWDSTLFHQYLKSFQLPVGKKVKDLSRGMKMKLMLAVAMSHGAKLLILDEPTSGLDPVARDELLEILSDYISDGEKSILFSTHITQDLEKIADYITLIDHGKIFYSGTKDDLLESYCIVKGGPNELTAEVRKNLIGFSTYETGFTGLMSTSKVGISPATLITEAPNLDEILVYISKKEKS